MAASATNEKILMYKNKLQEYTQKHALPLPTYQNVNEGFQHAPNFRSTVLVDGKSYEAKCTFLTRKQAEQEAARLALESLGKQITVTGCTLSYKDPSHSKSILYQYAEKNNLGKASFRTINLAGPGQVFLSYVKFGGKTFHGEVAGSKKMAEKLAARAVLVSLFELDAGSAPCMIQSSDKHYVPSPTRKEIDHAIPEKIKVESAEPGVDISSKQAEKAPQNLPPIQASIQVSKNLPRGQTSSQMRTVCFNSYGTVGRPNCKPAISPWEQNKKSGAESRNAPNNKPQLNNWAQNKNGMHGPVPGISNWEQNKKPVATPRNGLKRKLESNHWNLRSKKKLGS